MNKNKYISFVLILVQSVALFALTFYIGFVVQRNQFYELITAYGSFFLIYIFILRQIQQKQYSNNFFLYYWLLIGILLRGGLCYSIPNLSDDIYRFIWDGRLLLSGFNPFDYTPSQFMDKHVIIQGIDNELYKNINSRDYFTIYPTICQIIFGLSAKYSTNNMQAIFFIKSFLFFFEIGTIFLFLKIKNNFNAKNIDLKSNYSKKMSIWYALNPLVIFEIMGNGHFEGVMIFFILLAFYTWEKNKIWLSALFLAFGVATKLLPLLLLPLWWWHLESRKRWQFYSICIFVILLLFIPLFNSLFFEHFAESFKLYFVKFEFNGSLYFAIKKILVKIIGFYPNIYVAYIYICIITLVVLIISFYKKIAQRFSIYEKSLFSIFLYLVFSGTVHAWYGLLPFALSLLTNFRFAVLWTFTIFFSYSFYQYKEHNFLIIFLSYIVIYIAFFYEMRIRLSTNTPSVSAE